jgi:hypothetical protein
MVKKGMASAVAIAAMTGLFGCSEGDQSTITIDAPTNIVNPPPSGGNPPGNGGISQNCPAWSGAKPVDDDGNDVCALPAQIDQDRTLTSDIVWLMESRVTVGNGNGEIGADGELTSGNALQNVILTIEAGTQVKGATGTFANLLITRGSQIRANGTADAPIIFSSDDPGIEGSGEWGGLILHGFGEHNQCGVDTCNIDAEGESGFAGGFQADDSSGTLAYVIVAEGGFEFSVGNEINGISLVAVGSGTDMHHVQVESNSDDGIEFYGGAVNLKYGVFTNNLDDSVDWDEGYVGNLQYILVRQAPESFGNAFEMDTQGNPLPLSKPTLANVTVIGDGVDGDEEELLVFKAGSGGFFHNTVLTVASSNTTLMNCVDIQHPEGSSRTVTDGFESR